MRRLLVRLVSALFLLTVFSWIPPTLAQEGGNVPCDKAPVTLDLSGFKFKCVTASATAAYLAKARDEFTRAGLPTGALDIVLAADSTTHTLNYNTPEGGSPSKFGMIFLSVADPHHSLSIISLRDFVVRITTGSDVFDGDFQFDWRTHGKNGDYDTQRYIEEASSKTLGTGQTWTCFAFRWYRNQFAPAVMKRLLGFYCQNGDSELDDETVTKFLSALSVK